LGGKDAKFGFRQIKPTAVLRRIVPFEPLDQPSGFSRQGNRVKKSCGNETREEAVVPGGDLAFGAEARLARSLADQIVSDVL
jgi:hypothetical protein